MSGCGAGVPHDSGGERARRAENYGTQNHALDAKCTVVYINVDPASILAWTDYRYISKSSARTDSRHCFQSKPRLRHLAWPAATARAGRCTRHTCAALQVVPAGQQCLRSGQLTASASGQQSCLRGNGCVGASEGGGVTVLMRGNGEALLLRGYC